MKKPSSFLLESFITYFPSLGFTEIMKISIFEITFYYQKKNLSHMGRIIQKVKIMVYPFYWPLETLHPLEFLNWTPKTGPSSRKKKRGQHMLFSHKNGKWPFKIFDIFLLTSFYFSSFQFIKKEFLVNYPYQ